MTALSFERYPVDPSATESFEALVEELLARMRSASGALWADALRASDDDPSYVILSEWRTAADLDAWAGMASAAAFADDVDSILRGDATRRRFDSA